jgi:hypothetical protein
MNATISSIPLFCNRAVFLPKALHESLFALAADMEQRSAQRPEVTTIFTA